MRSEIEGRLVATQSATIVYRSRFRPDVVQPSGKQTGNPTASGQVSHPGPSTFHEQLQFAKCVIPRLLLVCDDELIDDGFDIVNIAHELLDGGRLFPLADAALQPDPPALPLDRDTGVRKAPIRENRLLDSRNDFLVVQIGIGKAAAPGLKTAGSAFRSPVRLLTPTSSYTLKGSLGCTATSWQDAVLALAGLDRNASTLDAQQGELP